MMDKSHSLHYVRTVPAEDMQFEGLFDEKGKRIPGDNIQEKWRHNPYSLRFESTADTGVELHVYGGKHQGTTLGTTSSTIPDWFGDSLQEGLPSFVSEKPPRNPNQVSVSYSHKGITVVHNAIQAARVGPRDRLSVLVSGGSGSGKGELTRQLAGKKENGAAVHRMDDYYFGWKFTDLLREIGIDSNFDMPGVANLAHYFRQHQKLLLGQEVRLPQNNMSTGIASNGDLMQLHGDQLTLYGDGIFLGGAPSLRNSADATIFVHTKKGSRLARRLMRDLFTGRTGQPLPEIAEQFVSTVHPMHMQYAETAKAPADFLIDNSWHVDEETPAPDGQKFIGEFQGTLDTNRLNKIDQSSEKQAFYTETELEEAACLAERTSGGHTTYWHRCYSRKAPESDEHVLLLDYEIEESLYKKLQHFYGKEKATITVERSSYQVPGIENALCHTNRTRLENGSTTDTITVEAPNKESAQTALQKLAIHNRQETTASIASIAINAVA